MPWTCIICSDFLSHVNGNKKSLTCNPNKNKKTSKQHKCHKKNNLNQKADVKFPQNKKKTTIASTM